MTANAESGWLEGVATRFRRRGFARTVARTAGFNAASTIAAGLAGVIVARAVGPTVRGEYAAITAWFGVALMVGGMGQPAALCFYVARDPQRARDYVATSRAMMLLSGAVVIMGGLLLAPLLAHGLHQVSAGYRIAFGASIMAFVGASYAFALQARDLHQWNLVRVSQPILSLIGILGALAAAVAHTRRRSDDPCCDHAVAIGLVIRFLPPRRLGTRSCASGIGLPARRLWEQRRLPH